MRMEWLFTLPVAAIFWAIWLLTVQAGGQAIFQWLLLFAATFMWIAGLWMREQTRRLGVESDRALAEARAVLDAIEKRGDQV